MHAQRAGKSGYNTWFDSGYMPCDSSWVLLDVLTHFLREGGTSDLEVHFILLSGVSWFWKGVHSRRFSCTTEVVARGNLDTICVSPLHLVVVFVRRQALPQKSFLEPSMTHSCELSRAREFSGVGGSFLPG